MARPKDADSARTWDAIVDAAHLELVETEGPPLLSIRKVARVAGVSTGTLHYYFSTKDDLLEACLDKFYERLAGKVAALAEDRDDDDRVARIVRAAVRFAREERRYLQLRAATNAERGALHPRRRDEAFGSMLTAVARTLGPFVETDEAETRLVVQTLSFAIARYALLTREELGKITGDGSRADELLEEHLVRIARVALGAAAHSSESTRKSSK